MASLRISPTEVQVSDTIYEFSDDEEADDFEACVATVELRYCEIEHPAINRRPADKDD